MTAIRQGTIQVWAETDTEAYERAKEYMPRSLESSEYSTEILETVEASELWEKGQWI